jgi:hypothetical protein
LLRLLRLFGKYLSSSLTLSFALAVLLSHRCSFSIGSLGSSLSGLLLCSAGLLLTPTGCKSLTMDLRILLRTVILSSWHLISNKAPQI